MNEVTYSGTTYSAKVTCDLCGSVVPAHLKTTHSAWHVTLQAALEATARPLDEPLFTGSPKVRQILLALDTHDAVDVQRMQQELGDLKVVTMRSLDRVRGMTVSAAWATTSAREHPRFVEAMQTIGPAVAFCTVEPVITAELATAAQTAGLERIA